MSFIPARPPRAGGSLGTAGGGAGGRGASSGAVGGARRGTGVGPRGAVTPEAEVREARDRRARDYLAHERAALAGGAPMPTPRTATALSHFSTGLDELEGGGGGHAGGLRVSAVRFEGALRRWVLVRCRRCRARGSTWRRRRLKWTELCTMCSTGSAAAYLFEMPPRRPLHLHPHVRLCLRFPQPFLLQFPPLHRRFMVVALAASFSMALM